MTEYFWVAPLLGGALIGLAATVLLALEGRVMGVSGIVGGLMDRKSNGHAWRWAFLLGMLITGIFLRSGEAPVFGSSPASTLGLIAAGLLVGFGTRLGSGCTSGHGVCGMSRLSLRSIVATLVFMAAGFITVWLVYGGKA